MKIKFGRLYALKEEYFYTDWVRYICPERIVEWPEEGFAVDEEVILYHAVDSNRSFRDAVWWINEHYEISNK